MMSRKRKPNRQMGGGWTTIVEGRGGRHRPSPTGHSAQNNGARNPYMAYPPDRRHPLGLGRPLARGGFQGQRRGFAPRFPEKHGMGANTITRAPPPPYGYNNRPYSVLPRTAGSGTPAAFRRAPPSQTNSLHNGSEHRASRGKEGTFGAKRIPKILQNNNAVRAPPAKVFNRPPQLPIASHKRDTPITNKMPTTPRFNRQRPQNRLPIVTLPTMPPRRCRLPLLGGRFQEESKPTSAPTPVQGTASSLASAAPRAQSSSQEMRCPPPPSRGERGRRPNPPPTPPNSVRVQRASARHNLNSSSANPSQQLVNPPPPKPPSRSVINKPKTSESLKRPPEKSDIVRQGTKTPKRFRPSFGKSSKLDIEDEDNIKDIFSCPTSPLIHMSESSVPLIQKALKSAAQRSGMDTKEYTREGSYSPEIDWTGDVRMDKSSSKEEKGSSKTESWNSLPSSAPAPLRPSFKAVSQSSESNQAINQTAQGQRKAVRRPKRKTEEPDKEKANKAPPKLKQVKNAPRGARPLVLLGSLQDGPTKREAGSKKHSSDNSNKSKPIESAYVHLSEKQGKAKAKLKEDGEVTTPDLDSVYNSEWLNTNSAATSKSTRKEAKRRKKARNQAKNQRHTIKRLQLKRNIILVPEIANRSPSPPKNIITAGGLESALKAIGEAGTILQPSEAENRQPSNSSGGEKTNKRKRRDSSLSGDPLAAQRSAKRQKASDQGDSNFKVNPVAMGLFGSLQEKTAQKGESGSVSMNGTQGRYNQATQHKNIAFVNLVEDPENSPPAVEEPPRSNNGVIFLIDGATAGNCISTFRKKKMLADVFVTKKMKMKKKSEHLNFHINPSIGHQLTYFAARHVARWKRKPPKGGRKEHKVYVITKDHRFNLLSKALKAEKVDVTFLEELSGLKALLDSIAK